MQNVGTILNLSSLYQSYPHSPFFFQISRLTLPFPPKKENKNHQQPIFQNLFKQIDTRDFISLKGSKTRVCRNEWKESSSSRSLTCRVLILKFRVAWKGVSKAWLSSLLKGKKRGEKTFLLAHRPPLD